MNIAMESVHTQLGPVVVAGGDGELGRLMVARLAEQGVDDIRVVGLRPYDGPERVDSFVCDLGREQQRWRLRAALKGARTVVSMVMPPLRTASAADYQRCNVDGVNALLAEARSAGVRSFVYVSSIAVMDHFVPHRDADETTPLPDPASYQIPYDRTKREGEDAVLAAHDPEGMWTCSVRCGSIICSPRAMQLTALLGRVAVVLTPGAPIDTNYGVNTAWGLWLAVAALEQRNVDAAGEVFFLTKGESLRGLDVAQRVARRLNTKVVTTPPWATQLIARGLRASHRLRVRLGMATPGIPLHRFLEIADYEQTFRNDKAEQVLGYAPIVSMEDAFDRLIDEHRAR